MSTRRLFLALFLLALFAMAVRETLDPDMWWHLRTGEYIVEHGLPRQDVFSFTVPDHRWITHEWLSQLFMWLVYAAGGLPGLMLTFAGLITLAFWLVYLRCAGQPYLAAFVVLLAAIVSAVTWGARPQIFNMVLMAGFIWLVEGVRTERLGARWLWLLPLLTVIWVNLHSGYLLGIVLLVTYVVGDGLQRWLGWQRQVGLTAKQVRLLLIVTGVSFLASLLNPNGYHLWVYPFETLGSSAMQQYIQEWHPPSFQNPIFWPFGLLLALGIVGGLLRRQDISLSGVLLFLGTGVAGLVSARHIPLFAVASAPVVTRIWWQIIAGKRLGEMIMPASGKPAPLLRALNGLVLAVALLGVLLWSGVKILNNERAIAENYPVAAVDYLRQSGLGDKRGFNNYNWGGYLIWRGLPVFVDGRADVYGDAFLFYYRKSFEGGSDWQEPLDAYAVSYALIDPSSRLAAKMAQSEEWQQVYVDEQAEIFRRIE